jgi:AcrR family transcriptional regulator
MVMVEIANETCRGRGRPQIRSDEATLELIVQAANEEFMAKSYAETSMNAVAHRAGVSTKTLYRLAPSKADLFKSVISRRIEIFILAIEQQSVGAPDLQSALEQILIAFGQLTLNKETTGIFRLVLGECERFPEIGHVFYEGAIKRAGGALARWLREQCRKGLLDLDDPDLAGGMLRGMMIMEPQRAAMLAQREPPGPEEIEARARMCATLFLNGCRPARRA